MLTCVRVRFFALLAVWALLLTSVATPARGQEATTTVAYAGNGGGVIEVVGGAARTIEVPATTVAWSPDGQRIAVGSVVTNEVHVIDVASGAVQLIATDFAVEAESYGDVGTIDWFSSTEVLIPTGVTGSIVSVAFDGSSRRGVVPSRGFGHFLIDAAPDGQHLIADQCTLEDGFCDGQALFRTSDGADLGYAGFDAAWAPNSRTIAYSAFGTITLRGVAGVDDEGPVVAEAVSGAGELVGLAFTPDGSALAFTDTADSRMRPWLTTRFDGCCERTALDTRVDGAIGEFSADGTLVTMSSDFSRDQIVRIGVGVVPNAFSPDSAIRFAPTEPSVPAPPAGTDPDNVVRYAASERIGTAIAIAADYPPERVEVVLVRADVAADALAATPLAVAAEGPLLLTAGDRLTPATATAIQQVLSPGGTVLLAGGVAALSDQVAADVQALGYAVERFAGADRYETAVMLAEAAIRTPVTIYLADGDTFAEALVAGSAAGRDDFASMMLTAGTTMPAATLAALQRSPESRVVAVGQAAAAAAAGLADEVVAGTDAYDTARLLAERLPRFGTEVALASGEDFPDGLAGGAHAAFRGVPLLLTRRDTLPEPAASYLRSNPAGVLTVYGGPAAISTAVTQAATAP